MNKKLFFGMMLSLAMAAGCSDNDNPAGGPDNPTPGNTETRYLSVNIAPAPSLPGTRAISGDKGFYEYGTDEENAVKTIRFYFFTTTDAAALVKAGSQANYVEISTTTTGTVDSSDIPNVEKLISANIVINTKDGDKFPAKMVTIINPNIVVLGTGALSLSELQAKTDAHVKQSNATNGFVMSSAVYKNGTEVAIAAEVTTANLKHNEADAKLNPITVFVERNVAKVKVGFDSDLPFKDKDSKLIKAQYKKGNDDLADITYKDDSNTDQNVYIDLKGWTLVNQPDKSFVIKSISAWDDNLFGTNVANKWNYAPYHRSFWAINPTNIQQNETFKWEEVAGTPAAAAMKAVTRLGGGGTTYTRYDIFTTNELYTEENAAESATNTSCKLPTEIVLAGKLVKEDGTALELCKWNGLKVAGISNLKSAMLSVTHLYKKETNNGTDTYTQIAATDLDFAQVTETGYEYKVKPVIAEGSKSVTWYTKDGGTYTALTGTGDTDEAKANNYLKEQLGYASVWKDGMTYFFFPIKHLGDEGKPGEYGVVRNHLYGVDITEMVGLGTPVYDPKVEIDPQKPDPDEDTYIAAEVKVLSWRFVNNDVKLDW